jgi:hypothetical protein
MNQTTIKTFLTDLADIGVIFSLSHNELTCRTPDGTMPPELRDIINQYGPQITHILRGKTIIQEAVDKISELWDAIENSGGSAAWDWIIKESPYRKEIQESEDNVNRIGSAGDLVKLRAACAAWVSAWRQGIEAWKMRLPRPPANGTQQTALVF